MKPHLLVPLFAVLLAGLCHAQNQTLPQQLSNLYAPLDKSQLATGYLYDLSVPMVEPLRYAGVLNDSNYTDINTFGMVYGEMLNAQTLFATSTLPTPSIYLDKIKSMHFGEPLKIALLAWKYERILPTAIQNNQIYYQNGQIFDVLNRNTSPYFQDTTFVAAPLSYEAPGLEPMIYLPTDLWLTNLEVIPTIYLNVSDGSGWKAIHPGDTIQAHYANSGTKDVQIRLNYNGRTAYCHFHLLIKDPIAEERDPGMRWPQELYKQFPVTSSKSFLDPTGLNAPGMATMHIFYNTQNCPGRMLRPLIVIEGYEEPGITESTYGRMFDLLDGKVLNNKTKNLTDYLYPAEYDLIYVDLANGSDWIERNAYVVEEVIKKVNELKAAAGSTEQNVVIGVSMGGVCSKFALLDMQTSGLDHDTRLFITYDSPLRGANIPIGTQCLVKYIRDNVGTSIPAVEKVWNAINAPTPSELLFYHINSALPDNTAEPINPVRATFMASMDAMGALNMRHVALSNGSASGDLLGTVSAGSVIASVSFDKADQCKVWKGITFCGNLTVGLIVRSTGNNTTTEVFTGIGALTVDFINSPLTLPPSCLKYNLFTKPFDNAPGSGSALGTAPLNPAVVPGGSNLGTAVTAAGFKIAPLATFAGMYHTFIPTFSSVSANMPSPLGSAVGCGTPTRCTNPTEISPSLYEVPAFGVNFTVNEVNELHIGLDERIALVLIDELTTGLNPILAQPFEVSGTLTSYFNIGTPVEPLIPTVTISTGKGELYLNNTGPIGYQGAGGINSPYNLIDVSTKCDAIITVENGSRLIIGAEVENKNAILHIAKGAKVIVKSGGTLRIQRNSSLEIEKQGLLKLEAGAIVELYDQPGGSLVTNGRPHIHIKNEGKLQFDGNISFQGDGYFEFDAGNIVQFPTLFNFTGSGKQYRHFKLNANAQLLKQGGQLTFSNTKFQIGCDAKPRIENFERLVLSSASFEYVNDGNCFPQAPSNSLNFSQIGFEAENGVLIYALSCDFNNLRRGIRARSITNNIYVRSCNFNEGEGLDFERVRYASISSVTGNHSTLSFDEVSTGITMNNSTLTNACTICENLPRGIVDLIDVKLFTMNGGLISQSADDTYELRGIDGNLGENNVFMQNGATIQNMWIGVEINGGLPGNQFNTDFGLMRMDCARILNCSGAGIAGQDVLLDIDAGINSNGLRPNEFKKGDLGGISKFFDICYFKRQPTQILANFNYWNKFSNGGHPEPIIDFE